MENKFALFKSINVKKCGKVFYTDLSSLVYPNSNITLPVIDCIENLYQIYGAGLHKNTIWLKTTTQRWNFTSKHRKHIIRV